MKKTPSLRVAFYARVSSERQAEEGTIASQVAALRQRIRADGCRIDAELEFCDDGVSGSTSFWALTSLSLAGTTPASTNAWYWASVSNSTGSDDGPIPRHVPATWSSTRSA